MASNHADLARTQDIATQKGALSLRSMTLIGTAGSEQNPRALLRMPGGDIETVQMGDTVQGRRVHAIEPGRVLMSHNGKQLILSTTMAEGLDRTGGARHTAQHDNR